MAVVLRKTLKKVVDVEDGSVTFELRRPTPVELNKFLDSRYDIDRRKGKMVDNSSEARCLFFDQLLVSVSDLEDENGQAIGPDRTAEIPSHWKIAIIQGEFEAVSIDAKN